jgi:type IV pilus assembly protein PilO
MAKKININLQNLPPAARVAIALVPGIIIIVLFYFIAYSPNSKEIKKLKSDIVSQQKQIAKDEAKVAKLDEIKKRYKQLEFSLKVLSQQLPEENEVSNLLKKISDKGLQSGLRIDLWKPGARSKHKSKIVYVIPVSVKMEGTYHNLGEFFSKLTGLDRIVNVKNIKLKEKSTKESLGNLAISFQVQTYSAIPLEELQKQKQKGKKGRRGRKR